MFFNTRLQTYLDPHGRQRQLFADIEALLLRVPGPLYQWLVLQHPEVKKALFMVACHHKSIAVKILWGLQHMQAEQLPPCKNGEACLALLASLALRGPHHETTRHELADKPGDIRPIGLPRAINMLPLALRHGAADMRRNASDFIRGKDEQFTQPQQLVYAPFIQQNRIALRNLVMVSHGCEAVFSLERGGALVSDHLAALLGNRQPNIKIPKLAPGQLVYKKTDHIERFKNAIKSQVGPNPNREVTIGICETLVGGGSANKVFEAVNDVLLVCPKINFKMLFERHTLHQNGDLDDEVTELFAYQKAPSHKLFMNRDEAIDLGKVKALVRGFTPRPSQAPLPGPVPQQAAVFIAKARYILGEDVGYQMSYNGPSASQPLIIFDHVRGRLKAIELRPAGGHTAREMLIRLVLGAYDDVLREHGLI